MSSEKLVNDFLVSKTDTKGIITYCNKAFIGISGYKEKELLHKPHSIVRHSDMPRCIFKYLWREIMQKKEVNAYVKNLAKNGDFYWVFANVTPSFDVNGNIVGYYSVRRKPNRDGINAVAPLYQNLLSIEKSQGLDASMSAFDDFAKQNNYRNLVLHLQLGTKAEEVK